MRILKFQDYNLYEKILESKDSTRRDFLKKMLTTAAVTAVVSSGLKNIYNLIINSYSDDDNQIIDAYLLRFSSHGKKFVQSIYEDTIPNFNDYLKIAEVQVMTIFQDWYEKGRNIKMNQKMYDAVVMVALRYGRKEFHKSEFLAQIKLSNFDRALSILENEKVDTWYLAKLDQVKKYEIKLFSSFIESKIDKKESRKGGNKSKKLIKLKDSGHSRVKYDLDKTQHDLVNKQLLDDLQTAAERADLVLTITTAKSGHSPFTIFGSESRHWKNSAVDISIINGVGSGGAKSATTGNPKFRELGNKLKDELVKLGYVWNIEHGMKKALLWQTRKGGNHYNHLHVSRQL